MVVQAAGLLFLGMLILYLVCLSVIPSQDYR